VTALALPVPEPADRAERRWRAGNGALISLTYTTHTSRNRGRPLRDGGACDGWCLTVRHPVSRVVISETYLGATVPEADLAAALDAVGATTTAKDPR